MVGGSSTSGTIVAAISASADRASRSGAATLAKSPRGAAGLQTVCGTALQHA